MISSRVGYLTKVRTRTFEGLAACPLVIFLLLSLLAASAASGENPQEIHRAAALIQAGKLDEAEALLWDVLKQRPENAPALNLLGSIRLQQKRFAESETLLTRATSLTPDFLPARINLSRVFHAQSQIDKEIATLVEAARLAPTDPEINTMLAAAYLKQNDYRQSLEALQRIPAARRPDKALPLLAASYLGLGSIREARALVPAVMSRAAKNPGLLVEFSEVLLDFDLVPDAQAALQIAEKRPPLTSEFFLAMGRARERKGELVLAQKNFQRALDLDPKSVSALQALAHLLADQGKWQKSMELLARCRAISPDSPEVLRKFAATSLHAGHAADAVDAAQQLIKLRPEEAEAVYLLGVAQLQNGDFEQARSSLEKYVKLRPADPLALLALGMDEVNLRDFPAARTNFEQCIQLNPKQVEAYYELGSLSKDQGDQPSAISYLEKAVAIDPGHARAQALLGQLYLSQRDYSKAQEHLTRAAELAPNVPDTHYQLGLLFARTNQHDHAQKEMDQFRKLKEKENPGPVSPGSAPAPTSPPYPPS
ncbi:MAG: Tetratricopeptide repeat protein [Candidatus Sulfotelmatobacter sp.]|nr:Tetratricopeptide repeat protein [Candidatus Sulfotelmatobacter sp.]